jgi:hypothetical protein
VGSVKSKPLKSLTFDGGSSFVEMMASAEKVLLFVPQPIPHRDPHGESITHHLKALVLNYVYICIGEDPQNAA